MIFYDFFALVIACNFCLVLQTPCVLPELTKLKKISIASGRHWLIFTGADRWTSLKKLLFEEGIVIYPPSGGIHRDSFSLSLVHSKHVTVLSHVDRFMAHPADDRREITRSVHRLVREFATLCPDAGIVGLFEVARRKWIDGGSTTDQWIAWVIYQCVVHEESSALWEIICGSLEPSSQWEKVTVLIRRAVRGRETQWKLRARKENFQRKFAIESAMET